MSYIYEPEVEEEEEGGYSIPKILVAVLALILIGAAVYIYLQEKKLTNSVTYLLDSKKQVEYDLNQMIEKYNLAIDDNGSLEGELKKERDQIIRYRDSIKGVEERDYDDISNFKKEITRLKEKSAIDFKSEKTEESTISSNDAEDSNDAENSNDVENSNDADNSDETEESSKDLTTDVASTEETISSGEESNTKTEPTTEEVEEKPIVSTTFNRVEIPPIYPGCNEGSAIEKKACFAKKVKRHLSKKFNTDIIDELELDSGKKRIWVHFNVDEFGNIANVSARGAHKDLETEAIRIVKKLPKMVAAKQNGNSVRISYSVPLTISVE